jgi:hypothetical protein
LSHTTKDHRSKEELAQGKVGMTKVNFDLHPAAFKAQVNLSQVNNNTKRGGELKIVIALVLIGIICTWNKEALTKCLNVDFGTMMANMLKCTAKTGVEFMKSISVNWLSITLAGMSGGVSTCLSMKPCKMAEEVEPERTRLRKGANVIKPRSMGTRKGMNNPFSFSSHFLPQLAESVNGNGFSNSKCFACQFFNALAKPSSVTLTIWQQQIIESQTPESSVVSCHFWQN